MGYSSKYDLIPNNQSNAPLEEEVFNEEYIGKLPEFEAISVLFDRMLKKAKEDPKNMNPNKWKENDQICKIITKVFGLKRVWFYWVPHDMRNAFTVTVYSFLVLGDSKDLVEYRSGKGFYDTSHQSVLTLYGYCGLLLPEAHMTGKELTAIFLHEIGHNFDFSPYHHVSFLLKWEILSGNYSTIDLNNQVKEEYRDELVANYDGYYNKENRQRQREREKYNKAIEKYLNSSLVSNLISCIIKALSMKNYMIISVPAMLLNMGSKKGEQFADSFATAYGYGPELISGLNKLGSFDNVKIVKDGKATVFFRDLNNCLSEIISGLVECHGTDQERCKDCITKLKRDLLTADYPKGMKEDLKKEIDRLEEIYYELLTFTPGDRDRITKGWRRLCDKLFGGKFNIAKLFKANQM